MYQISESFNLLHWINFGLSFNNAKNRILPMFTLLVHSFCFVLYSALMIAQNAGKINVWVITQNAVRETSNVHGGTIWGLLRTIGQELGGMQAFLPFLCIYSCDHTDMQNVRFHIVDVGTTEDMRTLVNLMASNYSESECMIRNNELFVSRLFPLSPEITHGNNNDKIIYPNAHTLTVKQF